MAIGQTHKRLALKATLITLPIAGANRPAGEFAARIRYTLRVPWQGVYKVSEYGEAHLHSESWTRYSSSFG